MALTIIDQTRQNINVPNFVTNGDGAQGTTNWTEGYYTAATRPSGTFTAAAGTGNFVISSTTTTPLGNGSTSLLFTKSAVNAQGKCAQYECDLSLDYRAKVLSINIDYIVTSGTFTAGSKSTDSSMIWYAAFYDGTTWTVAEPFTFKLFSNSTTISDVFRSNIQTPYNATKMRLIAYVAESTTSAWAVKAVCTVSPSQYVYGTPITDWQPFTVTAGTTGTIRATTTAPAFGTVAANNAMKRRVGSNLEIIWNFKQTTAGSAGSGIYLFDISQFGLQIDTTNLPANSNITNWSDLQPIVGTFYVADGAGTGGIGIGQVCVYSSTQLKMAYQYQSTVPAYSTSSWSSSGGSFAQSLVSFAVHFSVPITGWSSCVQMSDQTTQQVVAFNGTKASSAISTTFALTTGYTSNLDTTGSFNATTGLWTCPVAGTYEFYGYAGSSKATPSQIAGKFYKNGVDIGSINAWYSGTTANYPQANGTMLLSLIAGDTIGLWLANTQGADTATTIIFSGKRISGPASIAASEKVFADYFASANGTVSATAAINFDSKIVDTHGAVSVGSGTSWKFTAPRPGFYTVIADIRLASSQWPIIWKNGAPWKSMGGIRGQTNDIASYGTQIYLNAGDYIQVRSDGSNTYLGQAYDSVTYGYTTNITILGN